MARSQNRIAVGALRKAFWAPTAMFSGGQTGADIGWVAGAKALGVVTGGWVPKGWWTDDGAMPTLLQSYGMQEHPERGYPPRTEANVRESDATVILGDDTSPGCRLTKRFCLDYRKPFLVLPYRAGRFPPPDERQATVQTLRRFVWDHGVCRLNGAGNREKSNPGIGAYAVVISALAFLVPDILNQTTLPGPVPRDAVYVGRGTPWGNPFSHLDSRVPGTIRVQDRQEAIEAFQDWAWAPAQRDFRQKVVEKLGGKTLVCHCAPYPCHASVLRDIAALGPDANPFPGSMSHDSLTPDDIP